MSGKKLGPIKLRPNKKQYTSENWYIQVINPDGTENCFRLELETTSWADLYDEVWELHPNSYIKYYGKIKKIPRGSREPYNLASLFTFGSYEGNLLAEVLLQDVGQVFWYLENIEEFILDETAVRLAPMISEKTRARLGLINQIKWAYPT
jgi:hypothetical protein